MKDALKACLSEKALQVTQNTTNSLKEKKGVNMIILLVGSRSSKLWSMDAT